MRTKWYSYLSWLGLGFGLTLLLAMWQDNPWILLPYVFGVATVTVDLWVVRREAEQANQSKRETVVDIYNDLEDIPNPPFPLMPTPLPPPPTITRVELSVGAGGEYALEEFFSHSECDPTMDMATFVGKLKSTYYGLSRMDDDFGLLSEAEVVVVLNYSDGSSELASLTSWFDPAYPGQSWIPE